ncbi:hypothetical protein U0070_022149 [Myodes glareolus]|uniref:Uncharacterized protein n=1 Tax=Myodes glareolus TaxID=447135 RepID=A0AAW0I7M4_MYOGA
MKRDESLPLQAAYITSIVPSPTSRYHQHHLISTIGVITVTTRATSPEDKRLQSSDLAVERGKLALSFPAPAEISQLCEESSRALRKREAKAIDYIISKLIQDRIMRTSSKKPFADPVAQSAVTLLRPLSFDPLF